MIDEEIEIFSKAKKEKKSCPFCSDHWGKPARLFKSEEDFKESIYYGGGDKVINDPHGVEIATWAGKHNVGLSVSDGSAWVCAPAHPGCGCHWEEYNFKETTKKEDWFSEMDWEKYEKSSLSKFLKSSTNDYHCVMASLDDPEFISRFEKLQSKISKDDIYDEKEYGLEKDPHITILYGLTDKNKISEIEKYFRESKPISIKVLGLSVFDSSPDYDVLKYDIDSEDLVKHNNFLRENFDYESDYPDYNPHLTVAYIKKNKANKYIELYNTTPLQYELDGIKFSLKNGLKFMVNTIKPNFHKPLH